MRIQKVQVSALGIAALLCAQPAFAQSDSMPPPGGFQRSSLPNLAVDEGLWSLGARTSRNAVLTFDHYPNDTEVLALEASGLEVATYRTLPMVAVRGTGPELRSLVGLPGLRSLYFDRELEDFTQENTSVAQIAAPLELEHTADGFVVAMIDSRGARLLVIDGPSTPDGSGPIDGAGDSLSVAAVLEGIDWVFQNRLRDGIQMIANGWGARGELAPVDPLSVATKIARDAGLIVAFAAGDSGASPEGGNAYCAVPRVLCVPTWSNQP